MADEKMTRAARVMASKGAPKGGQARAAKLSHAARVKIARMGGKARQRKAGK